jgi:hypothetical protein
VQCVGRAPVCSAPVRSGARHPAVRGPGDTDGDVPRGTNREPRPRAECHHPRLQADSTERDAHHRHASAGRNGFIPCHHTRGRSHAATRPLTRNGSSRWTGNPCVEECPEDLRLSPVGASALASARNALAMFHVEHRAASLACGARGWRRTPDLRTRSGSWVEILAGQLVIPAPRRPAVDHSPVPCLIALTLRKVGHRAPSGRPKVSRGTLSRPRVAKTKRRGYARMSAHSPREARIHLRHRDRLTAPAPLLRQGLWPLLAGSRRPSANRPPVTDRRLHHHERLPVAWPRLAPAPFRPCPVLALSRAGGITTSFGHRVVRSRRRSVTAWLRHRLAPSPPGSVTDRLRHRPAPVPWTGHHSASAAFGPFIAQLRHDDPLSPLSPRCRRSVDDSRRQLVPRGRRLAARSAPRPSSAAQRCAGPRHRWLHGERHQRPLARTLGHIPLIPAGRQPITRTDLLTRAAAAIHHRSRRGLWRPSGPVQAEHRYPCLQTES